MANTKKMDEIQFAKLVKEFSALGELIRARQDEKQAISDRFDDEIRRFALGQISEKTVKSSVIKTNKEFAKLDDSIRKAIKSANEFTQRAKKFTNNQSPRKLTAKLTGIGTTVSKKAKKTVAKRKVAKRKKVVNKKRVKKVAPKRKATKKKPVRKVVPKRKATKKKK